MQPLTSFFCAKAESSLLKDYGIFFVKNYTNSCLFAQQMEGSTNVYYLDRSLYLLNSEELKTRYRVKALDSANLRELWEGQVKNLKTSQRVYYSPHTRDAYSDKQAIKTSIDRFAYTYSNEQKVSRGSSRYLMHLVRIAFTGFKFLPLVYTSRGMLCPTDTFLTTSKTTQANLENLASNNLIWYESVDEGTLLIRFNKNLLNYQSDKAPLFFESLVYH